MQNTIVRSMGLAVLATVLILSMVLLFWAAPLEYVLSFIDENVVVSSLVFVTLLVVATVLAPIAVIPAIPAVAILLGPFLTGVLSIVGWTLGGVIAFLIARHAGKPVLEQFISLKTIQKYERMLPEETHFITIVLLRMVIPVDVLSYAIGLTLSISLWKYTLATLIGVAWFSFSFAYLGDSLYTHNYVVFSLLAGGSLVILLIGWYLIVRRGRKDTNG